MTSEHIRDVFEIWFVILVTLIAAICILAGLIAWLRDRDLRGRRISNAKLYRERITPAIPFIHKDYK